MLNRTGKLNDSIVNRFAVRGEYTHVVAALALKADVKVEAIEPLLEPDRVYGLIVACKAARLTWSTTTMIVRNRPNCPPSTDRELEQCVAVFEIPAAVGRAMDHPMGLRSASGEEERAGGGCTGGHWKTEPVRLTAALPAREIRQPLDSTLTGFEIAAGTGSCRNMCAATARDGSRWRVICSIIGCWIHWLDAEVAMKRYLIFGAIGPFIGGFLMLFATTVASGYWTRYQLVGDRKIPRRVRQDAAIQLSVRHRAGADARRHRRHSLSRQAHSRPWCGC